MEIKEAIAKASEGGSLVIKGYRTGSGAIMNYVVQLIGSQGYKELVRESLELLKEGKVTKPGDIDDATWELAKQEKIASFEKTLAGGGPERVFTKPLQADVRGFFFYPDDPDTLILKNLKKMSDECVGDQGDGKTVKSATKTLAKKAIDDQLPVGKFIGQLNLAPGKFDSVEFNP